MSIGSPSKPFHLDLCFSHSRIIEPSGCAVCGVIHFSLTHAAQQSNQIRPMEMAPAVMQWSGTHVRSPIGNQIASGQLLVWGSIYTRQPPRAKAPIQIPIKNTLWLDSICQNLRQTKTTVICCQFLTLSGSNKFFHVWCVTVQLCADRYD